MNALVGALSDYEGAILLVSHDRFLIRRVIQGESANVDLSEEESDDEDEGKGTGLAKRKVVYQLKGGTLVERNGGVKDFENSLEARLKKLTWS